MSNIKLDVRVYPLDNPQGSTKAFANVGIEDLVAINGIRVVGGEKGDFVTMPQSKDKNGEYHDIAHPIIGELRKELNKAVLAEYKNPTRDANGQMLGRQVTTSVDGVEQGTLTIRVYPLREENGGSTLAFANVGIDNLVAINGIRVVSGEKGDFVAMPQSKDKNGEYHDIAFPINSSLRKELNKAVLEKHKEAVKDRSQSLGEQLREGKEQVYQQKAEKAACLPDRQAQPPQQSAAKKSPGLGD
jgi:stage V sporulation protein G